MSYIKNLIALEEGRFWRLIFGLVLLFIVWVILHKFVIFPDNFPDRSIINGVAFCVSWGFVGLALRAFHMVYDLLLQNKKDSGNDNKYKKFIDYLILRPIFIIIGSLIIFSLLRIYMPLDSPIFYTLSIPFCIILGFYSTELLYRVPNLVSRG